MPLELSIVIPSYNAQETIIPLLDSIYHSRFSLARSHLARLEEIEVILVDDHSTDSTLLIVQKFILRHTKLKISILTLKKNKGPAHARNAGARLAKGRILLFLDSDVLVYPNSIYELLKSFTDPDIHALTGVWDKKQNTRAFFPKFKALRDWSYWINERDPKNYYYLFSTRVAAIDRDLFARLGGFDETYKSALVEDIELTYRIARRYAVVFNPKVVVRHEFEGFWPVAAKYFWRSYYWSKIYRERKKFDPVATTGKEALTTISAGGVVGMGVLSILSYLSNLPAGRQGLSDLSGILAWIGVAFLMVHLWGVRKFLWFCYKEEGSIFAIRSFITGFILYLVILSGAFISTLSHWPKK